MMSKIETRKRKLAINTISSLLLQLVTLICGFIVPRLILSFYGSEVNGLVNSISQFLGVITLLDLGVGSVVQSALYKPLADNDNIAISKIYVSADKFFKRIAYILVVYICVLLVVYPLFVNSRFDHIYTAILILVIGISYFLQYYLSIVNKLLLSANQKGYIQNNIQIITLIINTILCFILIKIQCSIQIVKLASSLVFLLRPLYLNSYVKRHYNINKKISYDKEPIEQKWNGMAQHFASFILSGTDSIVLTIFSSLENVSVYSVYNLVITGVKNILLSLTNGFQSLIGDMIAKKEYEEVKKFFGYVEWVLHTGTTYIFGCTGILLLNFVKVYTDGVTDADYIQPLFAVLITAANAFHSIRLPYNILILASGHYRQTQSNYIIAMIMNIIISIATVKSFGLIGVTLGTLCAMLYQTIWMAQYDSKNIINRSMKYFWVQLLIDCMTVIIMWLSTSWIQLKTISYISWAILALKVCMISLIVVFVVNIVFQRKNTIKILSKLKIKGVKK